MWKGWGKKEVGEGEFGFYVENCEKLLMGLEIFFF